MLGRDSVNGVRNGLGKGWGKLRYRSGSDGPAAVAATVAAEVDDTPAAEVSYEGAADGDNNNNDNNNYNNNI